VKNVTTDILGKKYGRIHVGKQELDKIAIKKMKGLKRQRGESESQEKNKKVKATSEGDEE